MNQLANSTNFLVQNLDLNFRMWGICWSWVAFSNSWWESSVLQFESTLWYWRKRRTPLRL